MSYIGNEPIVSATRTITEVTATAGQTVFVANGGYTVGYIDVFLNGAQLQTVDFTATNGSTITLTEAAQVGDVIRLVAWGTFQSANLNGAGLVDGTVTQAKLATGVAGTAPAFSATLSANQTGVASSTNTKVAFNTKDFDTNSNFNTTTNRFTPTIAGYYQINAQLYLSGNGGYSGCSIYKNGVAYSYGNNISSNAGEVLSVASALIYLNGTTDYIEMYGFSILVSGTATFISVGTRFSASMVRAA